MNTREIRALSAVAQAQLVKKRDLSSEELLDVCLERIAEKNDDLAAFVHLDEARARREARRKDDGRAGASTPFHGVPMGIKDLNLVAGMFARFGSRAFERFIAFSNDQTVKQLIASGFLILGKTSTSELGALPMVETDLHPPTRNPWNPEYTAGGSSGGAASAVASGMLPIAQASDGAGSIRIPASFCGLSGIKPTRGRVHNPFNVDDRRLIYSMGPIGRSVLDVAAMLDAMAGLTAGTRHWAKAPKAPYQTTIDHELPRLRVKVVTSSHLAQTHPDVKAVVLRAAKILAGLGHEVEESAMVAGEVEEFLPVWQYTAANAPVHDWALTQPTTRWLAEHGRKVTLSQVHEVQAVMQRRILDWAQSADIWLMPSVPVLTPKVYATAGLSPQAAFDRCVHLGPFTAPFNVSGQPAATVPGGYFEKEGLPIGVQVVGQLLDDDLVLRVCRRLEIELAQTLIAERGREVPWLARHVGS